MAHPSATKKITTFLRSYAYCFLLFLICVKCWCLRCSPRLTSPKFCSLFLISSGIKNPVRVLSRRQVMGLVLGWRGLVALHGWPPDPRTEAWRRPLGFSSAWSSVCLFCNVTVLSFLTVVAWTWLLNLPLMKIAEVTVMQCTWQMLQNMC